RELRQQAVKRSASDSVTRVVRDPEVAVRADNRAGGDGARRHRHPRNDAGSRHLNHRVAESATDPQLLIGPDRDVLHTNAAPCELCNRSLGGDPGDPARTRFGEPHVAIWTQNDAERLRTWRWNDELHDIHRHVAGVADEDVDASDAVPSPLGKPDRVPDAGGDPGRQRFRSGDVELSNLTAGRDSPDLVPALIGEP